MFRPCRLTILALLIALSSRVATGQQSSIVPAMHGVYDWLWTQRVFGRLSAFDRETLPTSRDVILGHLRTLAKDSAAMSATDRGLLRDFLNEFDFDRLLENGLFRSVEPTNIPASTLQALRQRKDPYLLAVRLPDSSFSGAIAVSVGLGNAYDRIVGDQAHYLSHSWGAFSAFVNSDMGLGASVGIEKGEARNGSSTQLFALDSRFVGDWNYRMSQKALGAWHTEGWLSYARKNLRVDYGTGFASYGPAVTDAILLRADAPNITQLRMRIGTEKIHYTFVHGALPAAPGTTFDSTISYDGHVARVGVRPGRWVAMHRLAWSPTPKLTLTGYEMVVYGGRGADPRYVNPVYPIYASVDQDDPTNNDNGINGFDAVYRPTAGTEVYASALIDIILDGKWSRLFSLGREDENVKAVWSVGLQQRLPFDVRLGVGYTRADPFAYTHYTQLSAWVVDGQPLGTAIGPNSDEWAVRLTRWLPMRSRFMVGARRIRNGLNPVGSADVGGDLMSPLDASGVFMRGADVQSYHRVELELDTEPLRGLKVTWKRSQSTTDRGTRIPSHTGTTFLRVSYGF
ncbi:MAG: capsule assembly Wzi family protein [Gemmatimonadota bacterium]|nr:capsule assembly Wzi family protein [Gemmatimonadota bacterium]